VNYATDDECPVCGHVIKRRPTDFAGRPCVECMSMWVERRDRYRLRNARLTLEGVRDIIARARNAYNGRNG
jgi:hypothetical protein